ncbi:MAG: glycoside hydrolase family 15 protein [Burkholderiaceae bacterium]|nr:glycoside hydrolase family 15 protein [Burkholderiaceae bacterium]
MPSDPQAGACKPIEDYALIGNLLTAALVARDGSIDWLCLPRFDSDACFAALLGGPEHGRWRIGPPEDDCKVTRRYLPRTAIVETRFETSKGAFSVTDFMPFGDDDRKVELVRLVRGESGRPAVSMELVLRFGYGRTVPWVRRRDYGLRAVAGPDAVELVTPAALKNEGMRTSAAFEIEAGQSVPFTLSYHPSHRTASFVDDRSALLDRTAERWRTWCERCTLPPDAPQRWKDAVLRSLITLKALSHRPTGGLVAAPTTSLPEDFGGSRNWDYRYCWIRDATMTLYALLNSGYFDEAQAFRQWMLRATAGDPEQMQIMYGLAGERRLTEFELRWLPGYAGSRPVRVGNAAHDQLQLDVYGELMDVANASRRSRLDWGDEAWKLQRALLATLERKWHEPDRGIWEVRGPARHFTYSKLMCWVAFDRAAKAIEDCGLDGPLDRWRSIGDRIRSQILEFGFDRTRNTFVQYYGASSLDASLLLVAETGFVAPEDERFAGTVRAIEHDLVRDGFVLRYRTEDVDDGVCGNEGAFLPCSFWLVDAYVLLGRLDDAHALFERLLSVRNDLGLLAEEYDPQARRLCGNFPQAFSHVALVNTLHNLMRSASPSKQRSNREAPPRPQSGLQTGKHPGPDDPTIRADAPQ